MALSPFSQAKKPEAQGYKAGYRASSRTKIN